MIIIFAGPPGSGKGTQAQHFSSKYSLHHVSTGQMLRDEVERGSELGHIIKEKMGKGEFIDDNIILDLIKSTLKHGKHFIFDGFPRTLHQAQAFDTLLSDLNMKVDIVVDFNIDLEVLIERTIGRFSCRQCGAVYHEKMNPLPAGGRCLYCQGQEFSKRSDDTVEILTNRYQDYVKKTRPINDFYRNKKILKEIDSKRSISDVQTSVEILLNQLGLKA